MIKPSEFLRTTAPQTQMYTGEFIKWLKDMTSYLEEGLEKYPSEFKDCQSLSDWLEEIRFLI